MATAAILPLNYLVRDPPARVLGLTLAAILQMRKLQARKVTAGSRGRPSAGLLRKLEGIFEAAHVV